MQSPIKEDGLGSIVEYSLRESFRNNVEACMEELLPAEEDLKQNIFGGQLMPCLSMVF